MKKFFLFVTLFIVGYTYAQKFEGLAIIPVGPAIQYTSKKPADTITLYVYTGRDASFTLYEDENTNYNYEKGAFSNIPFSYNEVKHQLTIGQRKGNFPGMITNRVFNIVWIEKDKQRELNFESKGGAGLNYRGDEVRVNSK